MRASWRVGGSVACVAAWLPQLLTGYTPPGASYRRPPAVVTLCSGQRKCNGVFRYRRNGPRGVRRDTCDLPALRRCVSAVPPVWGLSCYSSHDCWPACQSASLPLRPLRGLLCSGRSAQRKICSVVLLQLQELCLTRRGAERLHWPLEADAGSYNGPSRSATSEAVTAWAWLRLERV